MLLVVPCGRIQVVRKVKRETQAPPNTTVCDDFPTKKDEAIPTEEKIHAVLRRYSPIFGLRIAETRLAAR